MTRLLVILGLALVAVTPAEAALVVSPPAGTPVSAGLLDRFTVKVKVTNRARKKAKASRVAFLLSADAKRGRSDLTLGAGVRIPALGAGKRATRKSPIAIPVAARTGSYRVLACLAKQCAASKPVAITGVDPLTVGFTRDEARARTHLPGIADRFEATGADGTYYELQLEGVDAEALTEIKLTPVTNFTPAPRAVDAQHGVLIEPAGLLLATPAKLRIVPPGGATRATTFAYGFNADGSAFHLESARFGSEQVLDRGIKEIISIDVRETGGYGAGAVRPLGASRRAASTASAGELDLPSEPRHQLSQKVAATFQREEFTDVGPLICDYYTAVVRPRLKVAETRGTRAQVFPVINEALGVERQLQLLGTSDSASCTQDLFDSLQRVMTRLLKEASDACKAPGGNPIDETVELLTLVRAAQLTGTTDQDTIVAYDLCAPVYDLDYRAVHETFAREAWLSRGVATGTARVDSFDPSTTSAPLDVPRPDVTYFNDCGGDFDSSSGTLMARALPVFEQRYVGTDIVTEGKLKLIVSSEMSALFTFGCAGADPPQPGEFVNHGGYQPVRSVLMAGEGGTATVSGGDDFDKPEPCDPDCRRATATFTVKPVNQ